jgi:endonuclease/exonuclease/phosphatase family metal-dependent hydrolase
MMPEQLAITTWNIAGGRQTASISSAIASARSDVACLQEVDRWSNRATNQDTLSKIFAPLGWQFSFYPSLQSYASAASAPDHLNLYGNAIGNRYPLIDTLGLDLGPLSTDRRFVEDAPETERRTAVFCRLQLRSRTVVVATTHLQFGNERTADRLAQARLLRAAIDHIVHGAEPVIITGDLNADHNEVSGWSLFRDFETGKLPRSVSGTYPSTAPNSGRRHIDHILVRNATISELINRSLPSASDHDLVTAVVTLP